MILKILVLKYGNNASYSYLAMPMILSKGIVKSFTKSF